MTSGPMGHNKTKQETITDWIANYANQFGFESLVIGVSGGIDSAVTSTLCAITKMKTYAVSMPIHQHIDQHDKSLEQLKWLDKNFVNVIPIKINLDDVFNTFKKTMPPDIQAEHGFINTKARLRMVTLYQIASSKCGLVVGTGNKIEDFGVGFFTKYGDGGVDISPIGDLYKSEVYDLAKYLKIPQSIQNAIPTDGLWDDGRTDEDQLGMTYKTIEDIMRNPSYKPRHVSLDDYKKFKDLQQRNNHKIAPIPVCKIH